MSWTHNNKKDNKFLFYSIHLFLHSYIYVYLLMRNLFHLKKNYELTICDEYIFDKCYGFVV